MKPPAPRRPHVAPPKFGDAQQALPPDAQPQQQQRQQDAEPGQGEALVDAGEGSPKASAAEPHSAAETGDRTGKAHMAAAAAAAAAAAKHATPAQKERMILEAASAAIAARQAEQGQGSDGRAASVTQEGPGDGVAQRNGIQQGSRGAPPAAASYTPPEWSGVPQGVPFSMEVMKGGAVVDNIDLSSKAYYTFGRTPNNDVVLEHPSSSRLHAVVQFRGEDGAAFLFDPGSTHGVYVNKKRIPAKKFVPFRVGDMARFGESSRLYVLGGPAELMPEEGPSREQRRQQTALQAIAARKEKEAALAKAQMDVALTGGASWGMQEDAFDIDEEGGEVDWRAYAATKGLTEKQQKVADKIRKREARIQSLQREIDKIKSKQVAMEELTAGQASTLVRNEQEIDKSMAEMEDLEETLCDSIRDSIGAKKREALGKEGEEGARKKRRRGDSDDEYEGSSDEDDFYDRTKGQGPQAGQPGSKRAAKAGRGAKGGQQQEVEDAASLYGKREALQEEKKMLEARLREEEEAAAGVAGGWGRKEQEAKSAAAPAVAAAAEAVDSLDAFMTGVVEAQIELDRVGALRRELAAVESQLARAERLLAIADPDGYFKPGSQAAVAAVEKAKKALEVEKKRKEAEERQRKEREAAKQKETEAFVPETEDEDEGAATAAAEQTVKLQHAQQPPAAALHRLERLEAEQGTGGLQLRRRPEAQPPAAEEPARVAPPADRAAEQSPGANVVPTAQQQQPPQKQQQVVSSYQARRAGIAAALAQQRAGSGGGGQQRLPAGGMGHNKDVAAEAQAQVLADLALLSQARRGAQAAEEDGAPMEDFDTPEAAAAAAAAYAASRGSIRKAESADWQPPAGQTGNGRSALNDELGY
ncbi:hypothetical protein N2152v2_001408 [Parachlorella kessleri]